MRIIAGDDGPVAIEHDGKLTVYFPPDDEEAGVVPLKDLVDFAAANEAAFQRFHKARSKHWS